MASKSLDGVLVKKANKGQSFTEDQLDQFMKCADQDTGPAFFLENFFIYNILFQVKCYTSLISFKKDWLITIIIIDSV